MRAPWCGSVRRTCRGFGRSRHLSYMPLPARTLLNRKGDTLMCAPLWPRFRCCPRSTGLVPWGNSTLRPSHSAAPMTTCRLARAAGSVQQGRGAPCHDSKRSWAGASMLQLYSPVPATTCRLAFVAGNAHWGHCQAVAFWSEGIHMMQYVQHAQKNARYTAWYNLGSYRIGHQKVR